MAAKSYNQPKFLNLVTMATNKIVQRSILTLTRKLVTKILVFGKLFRTTVISMAIKSYNQIKNVYANKEGSNKDIGFWKIIHYS